MINQFKSLIYKINKLVKLYTYQDKCKINIFIKINNYLQPNELNFYLIFYIYIIFRKCTCTYFKYIFLATFLSLKTKKNYMSRVQTNCTRL